MNYKIENNKENTINKIIAPQDAVWLSDFMTELPIGILNKKETGCGGTTLALTNSLNTIVVVPTVELIDNKCEQMNTERQLVFGVKGGVKAKDFYSYLDQLTENDVELPCKILCTYDSFYKILRWSQKDITDYSIVVDEYQELLMAYDYRGNAVDSLLKALKDFNKVTYLSATPIKFKYKPLQLREVQEHEIVWQNTIQIKPHRIKSTKPFLTAINMIKTHKMNGYKSNHRGHDTKELLFFINSVKSIRDMLDSTDLDPNEVKIVCSDNLQNRTLLQGYTIATALSENKPFTFITSKAFMGSDFYSETGLSIIISSVQKKYTLLDVATSIHQIAGRIRTKTNPFRHTIIHIFNTGATMMNEEEFDELVKLKEERTQYVIEYRSSLNPEAKRLLHHRFINKTEDDYANYDEEKDEIFYNELKMLNEKYSYDVIQKIYKDGVSVRASYAEENFNVETNQVFDIPEGDIISNCTRLSFRDIAKMYVTMFNDGLDCREIELSYPILKEIKDKYGIDKISALKYQESSLKRHIFENSTEASDVLDIEFTRAFKDGEYTLKEIKSIMKAIYKEFSIKGLPCTAKALSEYVNVTKIRKRIKVDGKTKQIQIYEVKS